MRTLRYLSAGMLLVTSIAGSQTAANHVSLGDKEYVAMNAAAALRHYQAAFADDPKNYEALWKASRSAVDLGSYEKNDEMRGVYYRNAEAIRPPRRRSQSIRCRRALSVSPARWGRTP